MPITTAEPDDPETIHLEPFTPPGETGRVRNVSVVVIAAGVLVALLYFGRVFFITSLTAIILACLLEPFVKLLRRIHVPRSIGSVVVIGLAGLLIYFASAASVQEVARFARELPRIGDRLGAIVDSAMDRIDSIEASTSRVFSRRQRAIDQPPALSRANRKRAVASAKNAVGQVTPAIPEVRIHDDRNPVTDYIYARLGTLYEYLLMASFVPFLVYFMLSWSEHLNRSFLGFFNPEARVTAARSLHNIGELIRAFVTGNFVLGVLLAVISSVAFFFLGLPYPFLAGTISGFISLVPYLGLPLALLVPGFVALAGSGTVPELVLIVAIVSLLHLIALNLLYPKIVGARVHLNPLAVTFALMFWAYLWDAAGLVLAIPLTAGIKAVCDNVRVLRPYGRLLGD